MPQMAPMNWSILFLLFSMIFLSFLVMSFFSPTYSPSQASALKTLPKKMNWKW